MFLGSGSVIHALGGEQDMRKMGGLKALYADDLLDLCDRDSGHRRARRLPPAFSPRILSFGRPSAARAARLSSGSIGWLTAGLTAFYMFRQLFLVFHGECRADDHAKAHLHESPAVMTLPLVILAAGSIFAGWLGAPEYLWGSRWDHWLAADLRRRSRSGSWLS